MDVYEASLTKSFIACRDTVMFLSYIQISWMASVMVTFTAYTIEPSTSQSFIMNIINPRRQRASDSYTKTRILHRLWLCGTLVMKLISPEIAKAEKNDFMEH